MTASNLQRGAVTDAVLAKAALINKPIGDGEMPRGGVAGWQGGQPNATGTNFIPYAVITPLAVSMGSGPLSDSGADVVIPYGVTSYGVSRTQCEWMADGVRAFIETLHRADIVMYQGQPNQYSRRVQQVVEQSIGAVQMVGVTDPPYYGQTDILALWTSR